MKLTTKILKALPEGDYKVKIEDFYYMSTKSGSAVKTNIQNLSEERINEIAKNKEGYFELKFSVPSEPPRTDTLRIWPARFFWSMEQIATKVDTEFEDTAELKGKEMELNFSHGYVDKDKNYVQRKQWNLYPQVVVLNEPDNGDDEVTSEESF